MKNYCTPKIQIAQLSLCDIILVSPLGNAENEIADIFSDELTI